MNEAQSISKGCFALGPFATKSSKKAKKNNIPISPGSFFVGELWKEKFSQIWPTIDAQLNKIEENAANTLLNDLVSFIDDSPTSWDHIPTAVILTGVNLPDHGSLFRRLESRLRQTLARVSVALVDGSDCSSLRHLVERTVSQLIGTNISEDEFESDDEEEEAPKVTPRDQCNLPHLVEHFANITVNALQSPTKRMKSPTPKIVVILQDFETLPPSVINRYIQILSGYRDRLPFVLVFGVATAVSVLGEILDHKAISRLSVESFVAQASVHYLNKTLDEVFLNPDCPFQLSGKLCKFFIDLFLFYDFSVSRFSQGIKYCVLEHFMDGGRVVGLLCCNENDLMRNVELLTEDDIIQIRMTPSLIAYAKRNDLTEKLEDNKFAKKTIYKLMKALRADIKFFYKCLRMLHILVHSLPQSPLGKLIRELYFKALTKDIAALADYKECRLLLGFMGRDQLIEKLDAMLELIQEDLDNVNVKEKLEGFKDRVLKAGLGSSKKSPVKKTCTGADFTGVKSRADLKRKVEEIGKAQKVKNEYEETREDILDYLMVDLLPSTFKKMSTLPLREIIYLNETEARFRVVPRIRANIHTALNNPARYLMCDCCRLKTDSDILPTMPDVCIAYKLHLECGTHINMYDWLQSFNMIVGGAKEDEDGDKIDPQMQARFAQAVADLELLGFIKPSSKPDHVIRLTSGN